MKSKNKKIIALGIVVMFASVGLMVSLGNKSNIMNHPLISFEENAEVQTNDQGIITTFLDSIAQKAYANEKSWDQSHNISIKRNYSNELSMIMNQWRIIYLKVLLNGENPVCCLGWESNASWNISISLIAKYMKHGKIEQKMSYNIENINGVDQVVTKVIPKSHTVEGTESTNWDGYSFYDQGSRPCWWWHVNFNYKVNYVTENIVVPSVSKSCVIPLEQCGPPTGQIKELPRGYIPQVMAIWDSLSSNSAGTNMVQAGVQVTPGQAPCVWYEHYYTHSNYGSYPMPNQHPGDIEPGNTLSVTISDFSNVNSFCIVMENLANGWTSYETVNVAKCTFTPYYFGSIVETPLMGSIVAQLPNFSPFSVYDIQGYANNNYINGGTAWSNGWYDYLYLQQNPKNQNLNNGFVNSQSCLGKYDISLVNTDYCYAKYSGDPTYCSPP